MNMQADASQELLTIALIIPVFSGEYIGRSSPWKYTQAPAHVKKQKDTVYIGNSSLLIIKRATPIPIMRDVTKFIFLVPNISTI